MADTSVRSVVPIVQSFAMLSLDVEQAGILMQGIDPQWPTLALLKENMISGHLERLVPGDFGIVLGSQIAHRLNVFVGDRVQVMMSEVTVIPGGVFPRIKRQRIAVSLKWARRLTVR